MKNRNNIKKFKYHSIKLTKINNEMKNILNYDYQLSMSN